MHELPVNLNILGVTDIADVTSSPDALYKFLNGLYKKVYQPNERLVFYSSEYISNQTFQYFIDTINEFDISNCFIAFVINQDQFERVINLLPVNNHYDLYPYTGPKTKNILENYKLSDSICTFPWMHMQILNNGNVTPCCATGLLIGNIKSNSISDILNNSIMSKLRDDLSRNKFPTSCEKCWLTERAGIESSRQRQLKLTKKDFLINYYNNPTVASLDLKSSNLCNFKCRICGPLDSSSHVAELKKHSSTELPTHLKWKDIPDNIQYELGSVLSTIRYLDLFGGEPLLIKSYTDLVISKAKLDSVADTYLHYNTNGSVFAEELIDSWKKFKKVTLHFSIDNINERFNIERSGGDFNQVSGNLKKYINLKLPNLDIRIMTTVSIINAFYVDELISWADELGVKVVLNFLVIPEELSLTHITQQTFNLLFEKYHNHPNPQLQEISSFIQQSTIISDTSKFKNLMQYYDLARNENFALTHKEIALSIGYML